MFTEADVHHPLEGWRSVAKSKEHDGGFVQTSVGDECGFPFISFFDPNVVESPLDVDDSEVYLAVWNLGF